MAVGDVKCRQVSKRSRNMLNSRRLFDNPTRVADAIRRNEVNLRWIGLPSRIYAHRHREHFVQRWLCGINQKYRAGLGIERLDVADAVVFLVGPGELVLLDV